MSLTTPISWEDFKKIDLRVGTVIEAVPFPEAHKPAFKLKIDLGTELGIKKSSAQITDLYSCEQLSDKQVLCVVNFPSKQIGPFISEVLVTGFADEAGKIILATTDMTMQNGARLI